MYNFRNEQGFFPDCRSKETYFVFAMSVKRVVLLLFDALVSNYLLTANLQFFLGYL